MDHSTQIIEAGGKRYVLTWRRTESVLEYNPLTHVHGIVFNHNGEILVGRPGLDKPWTILGGNIELGETVQETLERELWEEGSVTVRDVHVLGVQKVEVPHDPPHERNPYFQARCVALLNSQSTPKPDVGTAGHPVWELRFVPCAEIEQYVLWGENGHAMFTAAEEWYKSQRDQNVQ